MMDYLDSVNQKGMKIRSHYRIHDEHLIFKSIPPEVASLKIETIIDAGAAIGGFSFPLKKLFPQCDLVCLEPETQNFDLLSKNMKDFNRFELIQCALSYRGPTVHFYVVEEPFHHGTGGHAINPIARTELFKKVSDVKAMSIEDIVYRMEWKRVDLLKLDVEGEEYDILFRMNKDLVSNILLDYHKGKEFTLRFLEENFPDWKITMVKDIEMGSLFMNKS